MQSEKPFGSSKNMPLYKGDRDLEYERQNAIPYDQGEPGEIGYKCKNFKFCGEKLPEWWWSCKACYICTSCDTIFGTWTSGTIVKTGKGILDIEGRDEDCPVCLENTHEQVKLPKCSHWLCIICARDILWWREERYHLSGTPYGCPECPNGCENPIRGPQCCCIEYDDITDNWRKLNPDYSTKWGENEQISIELGEIDPGSVFGKRICPLCRTNQN